MSQIIKALAGMSLECARINPKDGKWSLKSRLQVQIYLNLRAETKINLNLQKFYSRVEVSSLFIYR